MKKEKITNFSDFVYYYKWHVIITVILVALLGFFIRDCATKIEDDMAVTMLISNYADMEASDNLAADFTKAGLIPDTDGDGINQVYVNIVTVPLEVKSEADMMGSQQAMLAMAADDSILFLVDEDLLEIYETQGAFDDISRKAAELGYGEDMVYTAENGTIMGLSLKGNEYLEGMGIITDTLYACFRPVIHDTSKPEIAAKLKAAEDILDHILS